MQPKKFYYSNQKTQWIQRVSVIRLVTLLDLSKGQDASQVVDVGFTWYPNYLHDEIEQC